MGDSNNVLKSGISIRIRRSDGRTHPAIVSSVNNVLQSVTVEWFEKGEIKGKEIDFETIFNLNSYLTLQNLNSKVMVTTTEQSNPKPKNRLTVRPSLPSTRSRLMSSDSKSASCFKLPKKSIGNKPLTRGVENNQEKPAALVRCQTNKRLSHLPKTISDPSIGPAARPRRSNVVKEVEKLKKNREERRIRQAELKEEKEAMMNVDPGNPNWQFLAMIKDYQNTLEFKPLKDSETVENHQITVCVRKRPLNKKELARREIDVVSVPRKDLVIVHEPKNKVDLTKYLENQQFRFDYAFDDTCNNETVYKYTAQPLVQTIFEGGMATCFAYGQTGSGKTHTMGGTFSGKMQDTRRGIYAMVAKDVFTLLQSDQYKHLRLIVASSFFEIYSGKVFDLLADKAKLRVLEDGKQQVQVVGLTERIVNSVEGVLSLIETGNKARTSGQTSANSNSSRSHAVFQITLRSPESYKLFGKFSLIDLAGNERGVDTSSADRLTRMEGAEINKSLLALKECIRALGRKGAHLPFRASVLTQVLRDSFIGDKTKTCMIAMISPGMGSCDHSLNTLRYADRVKELGAVEPEPLPSPPSVEEPPERMEEVPPPAESILVGLSQEPYSTTFSEEALSPELLSFHEALTRLQKLEDDMLDGFKAWKEKNRSWDTKENQLMAMTKQVDYDQDLFASGLNSVLMERLDHLQALLEKVISFREQLDAEEEMANNILKQRTQSSAA